MGKTKTIYSIDELKEFLLTRTPSLFVSSKTSTVLPYTIPEKFENLTIVDLSQIPGKCEMQGDKVRVTGGITWRDFRDFALSNNRQVKTYPTEDSANVLAGVATSCTGERCFGHGTLRDQIVELEYIDSWGNIKHLSSSKDLIDYELFAGNKENIEILKNYQKTYQKYDSFKNAPFPRLRKETDLMTGTEGQLGIVTSCLLETTKNESLKYLFLKVPRWEVDFEPHLEVYESVQNLRSSIHAVELLDSNSLSYLEPEERPVENKDLIILELFESDFEKVYEDLISRLTLTSDEDVFEISQGKFQKIRMGIPRAVFERNTAMGVVKKGTDVQQPGKNFRNLLKKYREFIDAGIGYNLFGHFGDAHLHFNFMPLPEQVDDAQKLLKELYKDVLNYEGSPFAEHGIGLLKQPFIKDFLEPIHLRMFQLLKANFDPHNQLFPLGYLNI